MIPALPPHLHLAQLPTPIERVHPSAPELAGIELFIKRDDLTGFALSGNKIRKLQFVLAHALAHEVDGVVTCGGFDSNHCRATALVAARLGLRRHLFLRTPDGRPRPDLQGNTLLDRIAGARVHWITPAQYAERDALLAEFAECRHREGERLAVIPEGASNALGALGYVDAVVELRDQLAALGASISHVVHAVGSGGTTAGLATGRQALGEEWTLLGISVGDDAAALTRHVFRVREELTPYGLPAPPEAADVEIIAGYQGQGYGRTTAGELSVQAEFARSTGILLDPCYTGKAFLGLIGEVRSGRIPAGSRVLFIHTGGAFANFSCGDVWREALRQLDGE